MHPFGIGRLRTGNIGRDLIFQIVENAAHHTTRLKKASLVGAKELVDVVAQQGPVFGDGGPMIPHVPRQKAANDCPSCESAP
jgi:hypothetical protein